MGRAERRRMERNDRIENRKGKLVLSKKELHDICDKAQRSTSEYNVEALMTVFALAEHRIHKFGRKRTLKTLAYIDELMKDVADGKVSIEKYKKELEDEVGIAIKI